MDTFRPVQSSAEFSLPQTPQRQGVMFRWFQTDCLPCGGDDCPAIEYDLHAGRDSNGRSASWQSTFSKNRTSYRRDITRVGMVPEEFDDLGGHTTIEIRTTLQTASVEFSMAAPLFHLRLFISRRHGALESLPQNPSLCPFRLAFCQPRRRRFHLPRRRISRIPLY